MKGASNCCAEAVRRVGLAPFFLNGSAFYLPACSVATDISMDDNLYDEFGNYIGPELEESENEEV